MNTINEHTTSVDSDDMARIIAAAGQPVPIRMVVTTPQGNIVVAMAQASLENDGAIQPDFPEAGFSRQVGAK
jgi:hypothetical protein